MRYEALYPASPERWSAPSLSDRFLALCARLDTAWRIRRERRQLASLDDRLLKDIGLSRSLAHVEAGRSFFDLPAGR